MEETPTPGVIKPQETVVILRILDSVSEQPLDAVAEAFAEAFAPWDRFRACCALCVLLQVCVQRNEQGRPLLRLWDVLRRPSPLSS